MKRNLILISLLLFVMTVKSRDINTGLFVLLNQDNYVGFIEGGNEYTNSGTAKHPGIKYSEDSVFADTILSRPVRTETKCACNSIEWSWSRVDKAKGYKINFVNDFKTAENLYNDTCFRQLKLASNKKYKLFIWAFNDSAVSEVLQAEAYTLPLDCGCTLYDERDNEAYSTVQIGNQCWMGENLRYETETGSSCYYKKEVMVKEYGRYYDYDIALNACPPGWKLPTLNDINLLMANYQKGPLELYDYLTDDKNVGLNIKLGGYCDPIGSEMFHFFGATSGIWFTNPEIANKAYILYVYKNQRGCRIFDGNKLLRYNVRCIKTD